jgi:hypothetical protein
MHITYLIGKGYDYELSKKIDEIILDMKMKQIQNNNNPTLIQPMPYQQSNINETWKDTLIIIIGAVMSIFIVFLIVKSINN